MTANNSHHNEDSTNGLPATLLIVDDDPIIREHLASIFDPKSFKILQADNGLKAISIAIDERPDLILLDVMMPGLDGYAVCNSLQENETTAATPIILITALQSSREETRGLEAGAVDYITKPINPKVVIARVNSQLQLKRNRDILASKSAKLDLTNKLLEQEIEEHYKTENSLKDAKEKIATASVLNDGLVKNMFQAMCDMLSSRDLYKFEHGMRVASIARLIGEELNLPDNDLNALELGCILHDVSKVAIPDDVLLKPGRFNPQDWEIMKLHPIMGAKIFMRRPSDKQIIEIIHHHHERLDGSGYPGGLKNDEISLLPRIAMIADVYESLVAKRQYKKSKSRDEALAYINNEVKEGKLDADILKVLELVTQSWDPEKISGHFFDADTRTNDTFRKKTYFREPQSDLYNYRYLFFLESSGLLDIHDYGYTLFKISIPDLDQINKKVGYLETDKLLDDFSSGLYDTIQKTESNGTINDVNILLRKGSSYLIYSNCDAEELQILEDEFKKHINHFEQLSNLSANLVKQRFTQDYTMQQAVYQILDDA